jgi:rhodanese-related sulfurtransferase
MSTPGGKAVLSPQDAFDKAKSGEIILVDIRTPEEWAQTGIPEGAIALDMRAPEFVQTLAKLRQDNPETPIALSCRTGNRSNYAVTALTQQGFPLLVDAHEGIAGGSNGPGWLAANLPVYPGTADEIAKRLDAVLN